MPASKKQSQPASLPSSPICLPLQKFSSTIVPRNSVGPLPWTHLSSHGNLFAIFDTVRTVQSDGSTTDHKRFKILRDPDVLEDLDLAILASESRRAIDMARDASDHNKDHNVAVIKKVPVIAVKYPISEGKVKRFQIRFRDDPDFYEALKQMANMGVHMLEAGTFPSHRPQDIQQGSAQYIPPVPQTPQLVTRRSTPVISALDSVVSKQNTTSRDTMLPPPNPSTTKVNASDLQYFRKQMPGRFQVEADLQTATGVPPTAMPSQSWIQGSDPVIDGNVYLPLNQTPAAINLYTPRPSTAPAQISQHLSQLLPPPRDLPFKASAGAVKRKSGAEVVAVNQENDIANDNERETQNETVIPDSQEATGSRTSVKRAKVAVSEHETKDPAVKRRKRQPAYKCDACKAKGPRSRCRHKQITPPLPSIEEIFSQGNPTTERNSEPANEIDTQALLSRSAATKKRNSASKASFRVAEPPHTTRITRSMSIAAHEASLGPKSVAAAAIPSTRKPPPCTPADQVIDRAPTPKAPPPPITTPTKALDCATSALVRAPVTATMVPPTEGADNHRQSSFAALLEASPLFAEASSRLNRFATMTSQQQGEMLKSFMLEQIGNSKFKKLCETMEKALSAGFGVGLWAVF